jgi:type I restriction enzyme S subunit
MDRWPSVNLGAILKVQNGFAFDSNFFINEPKGVPIIRIRDLARGFTQTYYSGPYSDKYVVNQGDFLIGMDGEFRCYVWSGPPALLNQRVCRLQEFASNVVPKFVYYAINEHLSAIEANTSFSTVKHISSSQIEEIVFSLPPKSEQRRIVRILDEAAQLRWLRAEADRRITVLIPALFNELFPSSDPDIPTVTVEEVAEDKKGSIRTGPFGSDLLHSEFGSEGVPVLGIDNVVSNEFKWTDPRCIPESKYTQLRRFRVFPGDVLITIMGTVGRCAIAPPDLPLCISTKHLCVITLDWACVLPEYLWASILFDQSVRCQTKIVGSGAIMEGWNSTIIKKLKVRLPSMERQEAFAGRVADIKNLRSSQGTSRQHLDNLFQSLLHRAFQSEP